MIFARQKKSILESARKIISLHTTQRGYASERFTAYTLRTAQRYYAVLSKKFREPPKDYQLTHLDRYVVCSDLHKDFVRWRNFSKYQQVATRRSVDQKRDLLREKYNGSNRRVVSVSTIAKSFCTLSTSLLAVFHLCK